MNYLTTFKNGWEMFKVKTKLTDRKESEDLKNPSILPSHHPVVERLIMIKQKKNSHADDLEYSA